MPTTADKLRSAAGAAYDGQPRAAPASALSITDFLSDGSLAALCAELSHLTGVPVELHDPRGHAIERYAGGDPGRQWRVAPEASPVLAGPHRSLPLAVGGVRIGAIVIGSGDPRLAPDARLRLERAISFMALTSSELCSSELEARARLSELSALARFSALLSRAASPQKVLDVALDLALDVLGLDAGSIVLLKDSEDARLAEKEEDLTLAASRNLTAGWLGYPEPLSKARVFDRLALEGHLVISEDIASDDRINIRERALEEGLRSALHAGMVFNDRALGVIRLYSRKPRVFEEGEKKLLQSLAAQAAAALEQSRLLALEQQEEATQRQLALAADVQRRMLPRSIPNFPRLDLAARYIPSYELGGDFYDFIELHGHMGLVVGDVVGKGVAAALLMASVRASLRAYTQDVYDLDEIVGRVNQSLARDTRDNEFASLWYGVIDPHKLRLTYCSAGHEPPIVVRVPKGRTPSPADVDELTVGGMVVGIDPHQRYQRAVFDLRPGDVIFAYTDGLSDASNFDGQRFGKQRIRDTLLRCLTEKPQAAAADIVERMLWELRQFIGLSRNRSDDKTLLAVRVK
ncbi:MAG: GAF domain-containing SpoIIE family protein phosphatase [Phycisphaerales bacterium]